MNNHVTTLGSSPSDVTTGTDVSAAAPEPDVLTEFAELLKKLTSKEVETLKELLKLFDKKELAAAQKFIRTQREQRLKKKVGEARQKKKPWSRIDVDKKKLLIEVDEELGEAAVPQCYEEIKRLLFIEKDPVFAKALEEWSRKELLFTSRVERKKSKAADLKNEIYQLIGFFSVFQGVLLTAVSQSSLLHCNNWWSPIALSAVASVVTVFGVVQKLSEIKKFQTTIHSEEQSLKEVTGRLSKLRTLGVEGFEFARFGHREKQEQSNSFQSKAYFWLVIVILIIFTVGFPISHWRILCDPGDDPYQAKISN